MKRKNDENCVVTNMFTVFWFNKQMNLKEGNPMSLVFQNIDPPPPSPPGECVLPPPTKAGGTHSPGGKGGWGVNILEDERYRISPLTVNNLSTIVPKLILCWSCTGLLAMADGC